MATTFKRHALVVEQAGFRFLAVGGFTDDSNEAWSAKADNTYTISGRMPPDDGQTAAHQFKIEVTCSQVEEFRPGPRRIPRIATSMTTRLPRQCSSGLTARTGLGHSRRSCCETLPSSSFPTGRAVPDADHQQVGVVAVHRLQQLLGGVDADGLGQLEFHPAVREPLFDVVDLAGPGESGIRVGLPGRRVDHL